MSISCKSSISQSRRSFGVQKDNYTQIEVSANYGDVSFFLEDKGSSTKSTAAVGISNNYTFRNQDMLYIEAKGFYGLNWDQGTILQDTSGKETYTGGTFETYGGSFFIMYDRPWAAVGLGIHMGNLLYGDTLNYLPIFYFRNGDKDLFGEIQICMHDPAPFPYGPVVKIGGGFSLGSKSNTILRLGLSENGLYIQPKTLINNYIEIEPYVYFFGSALYQLGFSFAYRINYR